MKMNQINIIQVYKTLFPWGDEKTFKSTWVFDDESVGFLQEPFVAGMPEMIDAAVAEAGIEDADLGFMMVFSHAPFPTGGPVLHELTLVAEEWRGAWYRGKIDGTRMTGWLCPGLLKYFPSPPKKIYVSMHKIVDLNAGANRPPEAEAHTGVGERGGEEKSREVRNLLYALMRD